MEVYDRDLPLQNILNKMAVDAKEFEKILEICSKKGITSANASFYYTDALTLINDVEKKYNDLFYIGLFDSGC